jgi:hypothetical protein
LNQIDGGANWRPRLLRQLAVEKSLGFIKGCFDGGW